MKFTAAIFSVAAVALAQTATASSRVVLANSPNSTRSITNSPVNITNPQGLTFKVNVTAPGPDGGILVSTIVAQIEEVRVIDISNSTHSHAFFTAAITDERDDVLVTLLGNVTQTSVSASAKEHA
jgi:hypothetical protein